MKTTKILSALLCVVIMGFSLSCKKDNKGDEPADPTPSEPVQEEVVYPSVDLGLSVKWATMNIGATKAEERGSYFAWGDTVAKSKYTWDTYKYGTENALTKYCTDGSYGLDGFVDNKTTLEMSDDVARVKWGGSWRIPTVDEWNELKSLCTWEWKSEGGVFGYKVSNNGNSIFLPAASWFNESGFSPIIVGHYWTNSLASSPTDAYNFFIADDSYYDINAYRCYGLTVRAVCDK